jgi:hypothetical protein
MGQNTTALETLGAMSSNTNRLDTLSDQDWTSLDAICNVELYELKQAMIREGVNIDLVHRYINHIRDFRRDARALFRQYGTQLDGLKVAVAHALYEVEDARKQDGRPLG